MTEDGECRLPRKTSLLSKNTQSEVRIEEIKLAISIEQDAKSPAVEVTLNDDQSLRLVQQSSEVNLVLDSQIEVC